MPPCEPARRDEPVLPRAQRLATTSAMVTTNFSMKNGLAGRRHEIRPHAEPHHEHRTGDRHGDQPARSPAPCSTGARATTVVGGKTADEFVGVHQSLRSFAARLASPRCSATRTAPSLMESFAAVSRIEALSTAIDCSTSRCRCGRLRKVGPDFARGQLLARLLGRQHVGKIVDIDEHPAAALAQGIDQLVARDREQPGTERRRRIPGVPLQMHRQQYLLHDILALVGRLARAREPALRRRPQDRRDHVKKPMIGGTVARVRPAASVPSTRSHARARAFSPEGSSQIGHLLRREPDPMQISGIPAQDGHRPMTGPVREPLPAPFSPRDDRNLSRFRSRKRHGRRRFVQWGGLATGEFADG